MKTLFLLAILAGFGGTLAAAHYVPWVSHARLPSQTSVVANGGRAERFMIHLPADRISATDAAAGGLRSSTADGLVQLPAQLAVQPLVVEHFKVRDAAGSVIGVAARHWAEGDGARTTAWSLLIPSRGVLLLTAPGEAPRALDTALENAGYNPGAEWRGEVAVALAPSGLVSGGTGEFEGFGGNYTETWRVTGVGVPTDIRGTIELDTVMQRPL